MKFISFLFIIGLTLSSSKFSKARQYDYGGDYDYDGGYGQQNEEGEEKDDLVSNGVDKYSKKFLLDPLNSHKNENSRDTQSSKGNIDFEKKLKDISEVFKKVTPDKYMKLYNDLLGVYSNLQKGKKSRSPEPELEKQKGDNSHSSSNESEEIKKLEKKWSNNDENKSSIDVENQKEKTTFKSDSTDDNEVKININLKNHGEQQKESELNQHHFQQSLDTIKKLITVFVSERKSEEKLLDDLKKTSQTDLSKFTNDLDSMNEDQEELEKQKDELTKEVEEAKQVSVTLKEKQEELQSDINRLLSESKITVQDSGVLSSNISHPIIKLKESDSSLLRLKRDHMKLSNFKTLAMESFKNIEQKRKEAIVVEEKLKKKLDSLTSDIDNVHSDIENKRKTKEKLEKEIQDLKTQIQAKDVEIEKISNDAKTTESSRFKEVDVITKNQRLKNYQELSDQITKLEKRLQNNKLTVQEKETEIEIAKRSEEKELDELEVQLTDLRNKGTSLLKEKRDKLQIETKKLRDLSVEQGRALEDARLNLNSLLINNYSKIKN